MFLGERHRRVVPLIEHGCVAGSAYILWWLARHVVDHCVHVDPVAGIGCETGLRILMGQS